MMKYLMLASAALAGALPMTSAFAQSTGTCLQSNRISASSVMDDRTLIVNDRAGRTYVVRLGGSCQGLTTTPRRIDFTSPLNQACLGPGDRIAFRHPRVGRNTCFVNSVSTDLVSVPPITGPFARVDR
jgi:hypothetical protein